MTKKLISVLLVTVLALSFLAPAATAAVTEEHLEAIEKIQQKMDQLHQELIDIYLEAQLITKEQADAAKEQIELRAQNRAYYGCGLGLGRGAFGKGPGGFGRGQGFGGMCPYGNRLPSAN